MSSISAWILSLCGMILVGLLVDIIMPQKVLTKFVKTIIGLFTLFMVVSPIASLDLNNLSVEKIFSTVEVDSNFVESREEEKLSALKKSIENTLNQNGYKNLKVNLEVNEENGLITGVFVDLKNLVLSNENLNIDKYTNIVTIVKQFVTISEEEIVFYE